MRPYWLAMLFFLIAGSPASAADMAVRLSGVPDDLSLPLREGANVVVTATIQGGKPRSVWLATNRHARMRIVLTRVGGGDYQINLSNPDVVALLRPAGRGGQFQIFAETAQGAVVPSVVVRYRFHAPLLPSPTVLVLTGGRWREEAPHPWRSFWYSPDQVKKLKVKFDERVRTPSASANVAGKSWPFVAAEARNVLVLELTADLREAWQANGTVAVQASQDGRPAVRRSLTARPVRLHLPDEPVSMTIIQRRSKTLPGSRDYLSVTLGDVTAGQVLITIRAADGTELLSAVSLREGDAAAFTLGTEHYRLSVTKLVNYLVGDDYGVVAVSRLPDEERAGIQADRKVIERLIAVLEQSKVTFIRNDQEEPASEGALRLRRKLEGAGQKTVTLDHFISRLGSRSQLTGKEYQIKLPDGKTVPARTWLRREADKLVKTPPEKK